MALLKSINTEFGIDATYWNISIANEDFKNKINELVITGYVSQEARANNHNPIAYQNISLSENEYIKDATRTQIYAVLKEKYFIDAMDV